MKVATDSQKLSSFDLSSRFITVLI